MWEDRSAVLGVQTLCLWKRSDIAGASLSACINYPSNFTVRTAEVPGLSLDHGGCQAQVSLLHRTQCQK